MMDLSMLGLHRHTLEDTAAALGMSIDEVRKAEIRAINKLRNNKDLQSLAKQAGILRENEATCSE